MTVDQLQLWERIQAFRFDEGKPAFSFSARLARDNGWSRIFTERVIHEYLRFAFLAVAAGHPVTPSDTVDQAWHLHLLYTHNYWERFCSEALGKPLHHGPTKGGGSERDKFSDWYNRTLESYRRFFDREPPADIWPAPVIRFGEDIHFRRVNSVRYWIIRKPRLHDLGLGHLLLRLIRLVQGGKYNVEPNY